MTKKGGKNSSAAAGSGLSGEGDMAPSSPFLDDFDEELCMELEEVGKELDRYKAESSRITDSGQKEHPSVKERISSSPLLKDIPQGPPEATAPSSLCATKPRKAETKTVAGDVVPAAPVSGVNPDVKEVSEEESECQLKALCSLKASLVGKLKIMVTHKTNLLHQKDFLLKNYDGDKAKLSKIVQTHLSQCKEVDFQIQCLNAQITATRKKIIALKGEKHLEIKNKKNKIDGSPTNEKHLLQFPKGISAKTDELCASSKGSLTDDTLETIQKEQKKKIIGAESGNGSQDDQTTVRHSSLHTMEPHLNSASCNTFKSLPTPAQPQEARDEECLAVEKLASTLAINPSSKNVNTLWCKTCNLFLTSIPGYIKHLELPDHLDKEHEGECCLHKLLNYPKKMHKEGGANTQEALGVEFIQSTKLIYCSLCECPLLTREEATNHSQSLQHTTKYKEYILNNMNKELAYQKAKMEAFTEYIKKRKANVKEKKQKLDDQVEDSSRKAIPKVNENEINTEPGLRRTELLKIKISNEKTRVRLPSKNDFSGVQEQPKEGMKLIKEGPLMPQKINVNVKTGKSVVGESTKKTLEHPEINKRQKIMN